MPMSTAPNLNTHGCRPAVMFAQLRQAGRAVVVLSLLVVSWLGLSCLVWSGLVLSCLVLSCLVFLIVCLVCCLVLQPCFAS